MTLLKISLQTFDQQISPCNNSFLLTNCECEWEIFDNIHLSYISAGAAAIHTALFWYCYLETLPHLIKLQVAEGK